MGAWAVWRMQTASGNADNFNWHELKHQMTLISQENKRAGLGTEYIIKSKTYPRNQVMQIYEDNSYTNSCLIHSAKYI